MPLLPKHIYDTIKMDFDACVENKTGLGTAGIVVINNDQDIIKCVELQGFINTKVVVNALLKRRFWMDVENVGKNGQR